MRTRIIVLLAALTLALSAGTSPALAKMSDEAAAPGLATAATALSDTPATSSFSWGISASKAVDKASPKLF